MPVSFPQKGFKKVAFEKVLFFKDRRDDAWWVVRCGLVLGRWFGPGPRSGWVGTQPAAWKPDGGRKRHRLSHSQDKTNRESWMTLCIAGHFGCRFFSSIADGGSYLHLFHINVSGAISNAWPSVIIIIKIA